MLRLILTTFSCLTPLILFSQSYFTAAGLRMGPSWGITVQQRVLERVTAEAVISNSIADDIGTFFLVGKIHNSLITKSANFFWGGGIHHRWIRDFDRNTITQNGVTVVAGAEITLSKFNISWDFRPMMHLDGEAGRVFNTESAISIRYVFIKRLRGSKNRGKRTPFWKQSRNGRSKNGGRNKQRGRKR